MRILYIHVPAAWLGMGGWSGIAIASIALARLAASAGADRGTRDRAAGCGVRGRVPGHRFDLGAADLGHVVAMGRAADLDAAAVLRLSRLHGAGARRCRAGRRRADPGDLRRSRDVLLPIIRYSVVWWNTLHQGPSIGLTRSTIDRVDPVAAAGSCWSGFTLLFAGDRADADARGAGASRRPRRGCAGWRAA